LYFVLHIVPAKCDLVIMMIIVIVSWDAQTEQVKRYSFILDDVVSYLGRDTLSWLRYSWSYSVPPSKCQDSTWIRQRPLLPKSFPTIIIRPSCYHAMARLDK
jgi:hypothetical protein